MSEHVTLSQLSRSTQETQEWINDLAEHRVFEDQAQAYSYLRAVLHAIRDRLTVEEAAHFASQLPMMIRGFYYEGWRPTLAPNDFDTADELYERVRESLGGTATPSSVPVPDGTRAVLELLQGRCDPGQMDHVRDQMPAEIAALFPEAVKA